MSISPTPVLCVRSSNLMTLVSGCKEPLNEVLMHSGSSLMRLQRVVIAGIMVPPNIPQVNWKKCHADERYEGVVRSMLENLPKLMGK